MAIKRRRPERKNTTQSLKDVLGEIMNQPNLRKGSAEFKAVHYWEKVMGKPVARVTKNVYFRNGVLFVSLNSSVVRGELVMLKDKIIKNMNEAIGSEAVKDIVFK